MTLTRYYRAEVTVSDHKPIYAHFKVKVNKVNQESRSRIEEELCEKFNNMKIAQQ